MKNTIFDDDTNLLGSILACEHSMAVTCQDIAARATAMAAIYYLGDAPSPRDLKALCDSAQGLRDDLAALQTLTHLQTQIAARSARNVPPSAVGLMDYDEWHALTPARRDAIYEEQPW